MSEDKPHTVHGGTYELTNEQYILKKFMKQNLKEGICLP